MCLLESNDVETTLECPSEPLSIHFADNGSVVVGCKDSEILVFSIRTGKILKKFAKHVTPFAIASIVAPGMPMLVSISSEYILILVVNQLRRLLARPMPPPVRPLLLRGVLSTMCSSCSMLRRPPH